MAKSKYYNGSYSAEDRITNSPVYQEYMRKYNKAYRKVKANRDRMNRSTKEYRRKNKEHFKAYQREYVRKNRERLNKENLEKYHKNKGKK